MLYVRFLCCWSFVMELVRDDGGGEGYKDGKIFFGIEVLGRIGY